MAWMPVFEMNPVFMQRRCLMVPRTDRANLLTEGSLIGDVGIEPVAGAMRFKIRLILKNDRCCWPRLRSPCLATYHFYGKL